MIVVRVELHRAITRKVSELARMVIANDGTENSPRFGNFDAWVYRGRNVEALDRSMVTGLRHKTGFKQARINRWPKAQLHVWNLVQIVLTAMDYGHGAFASSIAKGKVDIAVAPEGDAAYWRARAEAAEAALELYGEDS